MTSSQENILRELLSLFITDLISVLLHFYIFSCNKEVLIQIHKLYQDYKRIVYGISKGTKTGLLSVVKIIRYTAITWFVHFKGTFLQIILIKRNKQLLSSYWIISDTNWEHSDTHVFSHLTQNSSFT